MKSIVHAGAVFWSSLALAAFAQSPTLVSQPQSQTAGLGGSFTLSVSAANGAPVSLPSTPSGTLRLWLRADSGVVTNDSGQISQWQDGSGNLNHATQSNTNLQPQLVTSSLFQNQPAVRFDGIPNNSLGGYLQGQGDVSIPDAYTSFMVYSASAFPDSVCVPFLVGVPGGTYGANRDNCFTSTGELVFSSWAYDYPTGFIVPTNTARILEDRYDTNKTKMELFDVTASSQTAITKNTSGESAPAAGYYVGGLEASVGLTHYPYRFAGDISEFLIYRGSLSEADRQSVETYLKLKYLTGASVGPYSYQWRVNGTNILGATDAALTITNAQFSDAALYDVIVCNASGCTTSVVATVTVFDTTHCFPTPSGLIGWFAGDGDFSDLVSAHTSISSTGVTFGPGVSDQAFQFSGGGYVEATDDGGPDLRPQSLTIMGWFSLNSVGGLQNMVSKVAGNGTSESYTVFMSDNALIGVVGDTGGIGNFVQYQLNPVVGQWYHFAYTFDNTTKQQVLYVNGSAQASGLSGKSIGYDSHPLQLGTEYESGVRNFFMNGKLDEVALFNRALSSSEIMSIYEAGTNSMCKTVAPHISSNPQSQTVAVGGDIHIASLAGGSKPLAYQWTFNSSPIAGATATGYFKSNLQVSDSGSYALVVTNQYGTATSAPAIVSVGVPPTISGQPQSQTIAQGSSATFNVTAQGTTPAYQWRLNGTAIAQATNSSLTVANAQLANAGTYSVVVTNAFGTATSSNAVLRVDLVPTITGQPQNQTVFPGQNATFTVNANSTLPNVASGTLRLWLKADAGVVTNSSGFVSQWQDQSGNANHATQTNTSLQPILTNSTVLNNQPAVRFDGIQVTGQGDYLRGTNNVGLTNAFTSFLVHNMRGTNNEFDITCIGFPGQGGADRINYVRFQALCYSSWANDYYSSFIIPTNTARIWTDRMNTNRSSMEMFDTAVGSTTNFAWAISSQGTPAAGYYIGGVDPTIQFVNNGRNYAGDIAEVIYYRGSLNDGERLAVEQYLAQKYLGGNSTVTYQWQFNGANINGATNSALTVANSQATNAGTYSVIVCNGTGCATSSGATLYVETNSLLQGLVAYYPFNGNAQDASGNNNNGSPTNVVYGLDRKGQAGAAADFSSGNAWVSVPTLNAMSYKPVTYSAWFKLNSYPTTAERRSSDGWSEMTLVGRDQSGSLNQGALCLYTDSGGRSNSIIYYSGASGAFSGFTPDTNKWIHVAFTFDAADNATFYFNGQLVSSSVFTASQGANIPFNIGASAALINYRLGWRGMIDDVRVYNRALSASEVSQLFYSEAPASQLVPSIDVQPQSVNTVAGSKAVFSVGASGAPTLAYQWLLNSAPITGATTSTYTVNNAQLSDNGSSYSVVVTNSYGTATSSVAVLTVGLLPTILSYSPTAGPVGTVVTINGANFGTDTTDNFVVFGGVQAQVLSASSTQLTVVVPTGATYDAPKVTVGGLTAVAAVPFDVTFPTAGVLDSSSLAAPFVLPSGSPPGIFHSADIDGDGKADLVCLAGSSSPVLSVYRNVGTNGVLTTNSYAPRVDITLPQTYGWMAVADMDGDGKLDVVATSSAGVVSVFRNQSTPGNVTFASRVDLAAAVDPEGVKVGDIDGDGKLDIVVANYGNNSGTDISVFRNISSPGTITSNSFAARLNFTVGSSPYSLTLGDIDGDGKVDVIAPLRNASQVAILRNTSAIGSVSFAATTNFAAQSWPMTVNVSDLDGDGKVDVLVGNYMSASISIFKNNSTLGAVTLATRFDLPTATGGRPHGINVADIDGDGKPDVLATTEIPDGLMIYKNVGTNGTLALGSFATPVTFGAGYNAWFPAVADLDGDGKPDVIVNNVYSGDALVYRNLTVGPEPAIAGQPQSRTTTVGTSVSFSVSATGAAPLTYQWLLNGAPIANATTASYTVSNPQLTDNGSSYSVVVTNSYGTATSSNAVLTVGFAPSITVQPVSQTVGQGFAVGLSVVVDGSSPFSYQWYFNGGAVSGATGSALSLLNVQLSDSGNYSVVVTNVFGIATSTNAVVTVNLLPPVTSQPSSQTATAGDTVVFSAGVDPVLPAVSSGTLRLWLKGDTGVQTNGAGKVTQWQDQSGNTNHANAPTAAAQPSLVYPAALNGRAAVRFDGIQDNVNGDYLHGTGDVGIPDAYTSFIVYSALQLTNNENVLSCVGTPGMTFGGSRINDIGAQGTAQLNYSGWADDHYTHFIVSPNTFRIWTDRVDANLTKAELFDTTASTSTNFTFDTGGFSSPAAEYFIGGLDPNYTYVANGRNFSGDMAEILYYRGQLSDTDRLVVELYLKQKYFQSGSSYSYQWQFNGANMDGATNSSLTINNAQASNAGTYDVIVCNGPACTTSSNATLTVNVPPSITLQPESQSVIVGNPVTFTANGTGTAPLSYQWRHDGANISGATNTSLSIASAQLEDAGSYTFVVSSPYGSTTSSVATLQMIASTLVAGNVSGAGSGTVTEPISLVALGNESALGFSLAFDPTVLSLSGVTLGSNASGATLFFNTNQATSGRVGIVVSLPTDSTFASGTQQVALVTFNAALLATQTVSSINFVDTPTTRQVSDTLANSLPASYVNGSATVSATVFEGDVSPRPNGNQNVTITDWVQVGRFVAGLDAISSPSEFQRADCAPRSGLGNGNLTVSDWVQAGRYAVALDPLTAVGGPTGPGGSPQIAIQPKAPASRTITLDTATKNGSTNVVSVDLNAVGNENAVGFSVSFDSQLMQFVGASVGSGAPGASMNVNSSQATNGTIGVALAMPIGQSFNAGTQEFVRLNFVPTSYSPGTSNLTFTDAPVFREVSDVTANALSATYVDSSMTIDGLVPPLLTVAVDGSNNVVVSWPAATGFGLESNTSLSTNWTPVTVAPVTNGGNATVIQPISGDQFYFRLRKQ